MHVGDTQEAVEGSVSYLDVVVHAPPPPAGAPSAPTPTASEAVVPFNVRMDNNQEPSAAQMRLRTLTQF
jgi:hypothetical protein